MVSRCAAVLLASAAICVNGADWAVIVAGSNGWWNYRHQADACHAYQLMRAKGLPAENIIVMATDDIAHNSENPFPGKLFNKPDPNGPGVDVYAGCKIDYSGADVTPENFLKILDGTASGRSLAKSTEEDEVFITFFDHGAPGLICFGYDELHKQQLLDTFQTMHDKKMYKKLVFYLESCESGSMFEGMNIPGIYAVSAANSTQSSWGTYCYPNAVVNGTHIETCLGDLFSVVWMEDSDAEDTTKETLTTQYNIVKEKVTKSQVLQWGDLSFGSDTVSEYIGNQDVALGTVASSPEAVNSAVSARATHLHLLYSKYQLTDSSSKRVEAAGMLQSEVQRQLAAEEAYRRFAVMAYPDDEQAQHALRVRTEKPKNMECELATHRTIRTTCAHYFDANSGFALQFHQVVVNVCADIATGLSFDAPAAAASLCEGMADGAYLV